MCCSPKTERMVGVSNEALQQTRIEETPYGRMARPRSLARPTRCCTVAPRAVAWSRAALETGAYAIVGEARR